MRTTGISTLDHAPQVVAEWIDELNDDLDWDDKSRCYLLFRETPHAVRDYLTVDEAADLSAQLPIPVRGIYFDGWVPSRTPAHPRGKADFIARINRRFVKAPLEDPERAVSTVFDLLRRNISEGEVDVVAGSMRKSLCELWT